MRGLLCFLIMAFSFRTLTAQVPVDREPHHKVVLQNAYMRLLEGKIRKNDTTPLHRHAANSVVIFLSKSTFGIGTPGSPPAVTTVEPGDIKYAPYGDKPVNHTVWNQTPALFHFYVVELPAPGDKLPARSSPGDSCPTLRQPGFTVRSREPRVTSYDLDIAAGQNVHLPPAHCARLLVAISGAVMAHGRSLSPFQYRFFPPGLSADLSGHAHCVLLELR